MAQTTREPQRITPEELKSLLDSGAAVTVIDVRTPTSYRESEYKVKGAIRISPDEIEMRMREIPRDREIVTYCT